MSKKKEEEKKEENTGMLDRMIKSRTLMVCKPVDDKMMDQVSCALLMMQEEDEEKPITVFVNSPGGSADSGFAIYDMLQFVKPKIITVCSGLCASAAVLIFLGGDEGCRYSLKNSRFLLHQPSTAAQGSASDLQITASEILKLRERYDSIVAEATGKTAKQISGDCSRDFWLNATEAVEYGLVNKIVTSWTELPV